MTFNGYDIGYASLIVTEELKTNNQRNLLGNGVVRTRLMAPMSSVYSWEVKRMTDLMKFVVRSMIVTASFDVENVTVVDDDGQSFTGKLHGKGIKFTRRAGPFWSCIIPIRVVISA